VIAIRSTISTVDTLADSLAHFAAELQLEAVPDEARRQAALCVLDLVGCMVAGSATPEAKAHYDAEARASSGSVRVAAVGHPQPLPLESAARVNAFCGDVFELNDLIGGHASIAVIPAALAAAESCGATGADLLRAVIAGIEVTGRVYNAYYPTKRPSADPGMGAIGVTNTIGAAAAVSVLFDLSPARMREALAIATAFGQWTPSVVAYGDGGTIKPLMFGAWPASTGISAVRYAMSGLTGPRALLEAPSGFFASVADGFDPAAITAPAGWNLETPRRKRHACCGLIHSALDAVADLRRRLAPGDFRQGRIKVRMPPHSYPIVNREGAPDTDNDARFSLKFCVAVVAAGADLIVPAHSIHFREELDRPEIRAWFDRIEAEPDATLRHYEQSQVTIEWPGGGAVAPAVAPRGSPSNPLSADELHDKFRLLADGRRPAAEIEDYIERMASLERQPACDWIGRGFSTAS
jgi:2-methylcitrate dehydratase PrpD